MPIEETIDVRNSEEIEDIIEAVPTWILRWGITVVFSILISIIILAAFIQYPDIVKTPLKISSMNAPKTVVARQEGKLVKLLAVNGEEVKKIKYWLF